MTIIGTSFGFQHRRFSKFHYSSASSRFAATVTFRLHVADWRLWRWNKQSPIGAWSDERVKLISQVFCSTEVPILLPGRQPRVYQWLAQVLVLRKISSVLDPDRPIWLVKKISFDKLTVICSESSMKPRYFSLLVGTKTYFSSWIVNPSVWKRLTVASMFFFLFLFLLTFFSCLAP